MKLIKIFSSFMILLLSLSIVSAAVDISEPQQILSENKELLAEWATWLGGAAVGVVAVTAVVGVCAASLGIACAPAATVGAATVATALAAGVGAGVTAGVVINYADSNSDDPSHYVDSIDWPQTTSFIIVGGIDDNGQPLTPLYEGQKRSEWIEIVPIDDICKLSGSEQPLTIRNIDEGTWDGISWTFKLPCFHKHKENEDFNSYFMHEITKISNTDTEYFNCQIVNNEIYPYHMTTQFIQYSTGTTSYTGNGGKNLINEDTISKSDQVQKASSAKIMCEILQDVPEDILGVRIDLENKFYSWDDGDNIWSTSSASQTIDGKTFSLYVPYSHINDAPAVESFSVDVTDVSGYTFKMSDFDNVFTDEEDETWSFIEIGPSLYGYLYLNGELLEFEEDDKKSNSRSDIEDSSNPDLTSLVFVPNEDFKSLELESQGNLLSFALYDSEMLTVTEDSENVYYDINFEKVYEVPDYATELILPEIKLNEDEEELFKEIKVLNENTYLEETISEYSYIQTGSQHLIDATHGDCLDNTNNNKNYFSMELDNFCELDEPIFNVFDQSNNEEICLDIVEVIKFNPEGSTTTSHNLIVRFNEHFNGEQDLIVTCSDGQEYLASGNLNIIVEPTTDPTEFSNGEQTIREGVETKIRIPGINVDLNSEDNIFIYEPNMGSVVTLAGAPFFDEEGYYFNYTSATTVLEEGYSETIIYDVFDWDFETDQPNDQQYEIVISVTNQLGAPTNEDFEINFYEDTISEFINEDENDIFKSGILNNERIAFSEGDTEITRVKFTDLPEDSELSLNYEKNGEIVNEDVVQNKVYLFDEYPEYSFVLTTPLNAYGIDYDSFDYKIGNTRYFAEESATVTINLININDRPVFNSVEDIDELLDENGNLLPLKEFYDFSLESDIDEDGIINLNIDIEDYDNDELIIFAQTSRPDLILDEDILITGDSQKTISFDLPQDVSDIDFDLTVQIEEIANEDGELITQNALANSFTFNYYINPINDVPIGQNITYVSYVYSSIYVSEEDLNYTDADDGDELESIKILTLPSKGKIELTPENGPVLPIEVGANIPKNAIKDIRFTLADGVSGSSIVRYQLFDGEDYSATYEINFTLEPSPFGINSQPASRGGFPIPNLEYGEWSCEFGYEPVPSSIDFGYTCQEIPNEAPVADFTIYPLTDNTSYLGQTLYLKSISTDPDSTGFLNYNWSLQENGTKTIQLTDFDGSICTDGVCTVTLIVSDGEDSDSITKRFLLEEVEEAPPEEDYSTLVATEGVTYTDNQLSALGLKKGSVTKKSTKIFTVDTSGKLIKIETLQQATGSPGSSNQQTNAEDYAQNWVPNDGYCSKTLGENTVNSPNDCEKKSNMVPILLIFSFITVLGIGAFVAWKKGLFSKSSSPTQSFASTTAYSAPTYQPPSYSSTNTTTQNPTNNLRSVVQEKISEGYSSGEIKSYLISKGYSESDIDNSLNS